MNYFAMFLTLLFIALKLTHIIEWHWVWVLAPAWIGAGVAVFIMLCVSVIAILAAASKLGK